MSIKYKVISRGTPGVVGGGDQKFYASANSSGKESLEGLTELIELSSTVSGADIRAVLYAMVKVMQKSLADGKIVELGELGTLRVNLSSNGEASEEKVTASSIKSSKVVFKPGKDIKNMLKTLEYEKIS